ncbi:MAG: DUF1080 domain-containing protein [Bryobacterales bacterium]|nr:DUF1080 domain-containing protein [Bryobacterales bacterium]
MFKTLFISVIAVAFSLIASAQDAKQFLGRWDFIATPSSGSPYPQWMELTQKGSAIEGRVQPRGGGWVKIQSAKMENGKLIVAIYPASERRPAIQWELSAAGTDKLSGVEKRGENIGPALAGVRAPRLDRPMPKAWTEPRPLFNGKDLTGWLPIGNVANNKWMARDGELVNNNPQVEGQRGPGAANIRTLDEFNDLKLHIEVLCPEHGNSGIYLRGRYEVQVGTEGGRLPDHEMGSIYSYYPPPPGAELGLGKWTSFDITLVGRRVTVVRDGKVYHDNVEIPGPTGGALDSHEAEPGPFFLQGDHHGVIRYRNIKVSVPMD